MAGPITFLLILTAMFLGTNNMSNLTDNELVVAKTHKVIIEGMEFHPAELVINKGDKVVWENKGIVEHDITQFPGQEWTSSQFQPGKSWSRTFDESVDYYCSIHPTMKGKIIVK